MDDLGDAFMDGWNSYQFNVNIFSKMSLKQIILNFYNNKYINFIIKVLIIAFFVKILQTDTDKLISIIKHFFQNFK